MRASVLTALALLLSASPVSANNDRSNCTVYGVPAVCSDAVIVARAAQLAQQNCPRRTTDHAGWARNLDTLRGPYGSATWLAADVCMLAYDAK